MKVLAHEKRQLHGVITTAFGLREVRGIYRKEGIRIDRWKLPYKIKALYMCDDDDLSVVVQKSLPIEPKLFALVHELKHHYCDRPALQAGQALCGDYNANELIEKGAEVFAAEFIFPVAEFDAFLQQLGIRVWTAENVVRLQRSCGAKVSYTFLCKRLRSMRLIADGQFRSVQFRKLEEEIYGQPYYRRVRRPRALARKRAQ